MGMLRTPIRTQILSTTPGKDLIVTGTPFGGASDGPFTIRLKIIVDTASLNPLAIKPEARRNIPLRSECLGSRLVGTCSKVLQVRCAKSVLRDLSGSGKVKHEVKDIKCPDLHTGNEKRLSGKWNDCALKADQTPIGLASVTSSRLLFVDESAVINPASGRSSRNNLH
jgi:hypothetical protein